MKLNIILIASLVSFTSGLVVKKPVKFNQIFVFGDSLSDYKNTYELSNFTKPDQKYYNIGRYSNGPTWIEYLSEFLGGAKLINFSHAGATSDNLEFKASVLEGGVPGALQQVELHKTYQVSQALNPSKCQKNLYTFVFAGNDFSLPNASLEKVVSNWERSVRTLLSSYPIKHLLIGTGSPLDKSPSVSLLPLPYQQAFANIEKGIELQWINIVAKLKSEYPKTTFYSFNSKDPWSKLANGTASLNGRTDLESVKPCLTKTTLPDETVQTTICQDPSKYLFWDNLHPTTQVHKYLANEAFELILRS